MPSTANRTRRLLGAAIGVAALLATAARATVLTMDVRNSGDAYQGNQYILTGTPVNYVSGGVTYGTQVSSTSQTAGSEYFHYSLTGGATPNIVTALSETGTDGSRFRQYTGGALWDKILFAAGIPTGQSLFWSFAPSGGYAVTLTSFTLQDYAVDFGAGSGDWRLHDTTSAGPVLALGNWTMSLGDTSVHTLAMNYTGGYGQTLVFEYRITAGPDASNIGFDNLQFSQTIPEPSAGLALLLGVGTGVLRRRR